MRRKARVTEKLEKLSVADGLRAVKFAEVVVLLIDATSPFDKQDIQLADLVEREGRGMVIAINKWDLKLDRKEVRQTVNDTLLRALPKLRGVPVVMLSAQTGKGVEKPMPAVQRQYEIWNARIGTAKLNKWLGAVIDRHPPPADKGRPVRLRYITQAKSRPPTFVTFSSRGHAVPESYQRYLANNLRETFELDGVPLRIFVRKGKNPYRRPLGQFLPDFVYLVLHVNGIVSAERREIPCGHHADHEDAPSTRKPIHKKSAKRTSARLMALGYTRWRKNRVRKVMPRRYANRPRGDRTRRPSAVQAQPFRDHVVQPHVRPQSSTDATTMRLPKRSAKSQCGRNLDKVFIRIHDAVDAIGFGRGEKSEQFFHQSCSCF